MELVVLNVVEVIAAVVKEEVVTVMVVVEEVVGGGCEVGEVLEAVLVGEIGVEVVVVVVV